MAGILDRTRHNNREPRRWFRFRASRKPPWCSFGAADMVSRKMGQQIVTDADRSVRKSNIWPLLAGLRFFFAMWVLFDHTYNFGPADRAMPIFTKSGLVAVMCFFVISGFSIHHSIANRPKGYGTRRFWRIAPTNALAVAIGWFAYVVLGLSGGYGTPPVTPTAAQWVGSLLLLQCVFPVGIHFLFPAWSLSIEALYYLAAPVLVKQRDSFAILIAAALSCLLFILWPFIRDVYIAEPTYLIAAAAFLWAWLAGWLAYRGNRFMVFGFMVGGFLGIWTQAKFFGIVDFTSGAANLLAWALTLVIVFFRIGVPAGDKGRMALNYLGEISYPLYLLHYPVLFALTSSLLKKHPDWNYGIVETIVALAVAVLAYHLVDRPLRSGIGRRRAHPLFEYPRRSETNTI
jgi:peptidoglycan/LPS O-acetylase OafA/YrhL